MKRNAVGSIKVTYFYALYMLAIVALMGARAHSFTTASSASNAAVAITYGKNNDLSSSNYGTFVVVGDISGSVSSANYQNNVGFLITNPFVNGESCTVNAECASDTCCNGLCATSCGSANESSGSAGSSSSGSSGGSSVFDSSFVPPPKTFHQQFFSPVLKNREYTIRVKSDLLAITNVSFRTTKDIDSIDLTIALVEDPVVAAANVYQYDSIASAELNSQNIEYMEIYFRVPIGQERDPGTIKLQRYSNAEWGDLVTRYVRSDSTYYYFVSETDDIGLFAISQGVSVSKPQPSLGQTEPLQKVTGQTVKPQEKVPRQESPGVVTKPKGIRGKLGIISTFLALLFLVGGVLGIQAYRSQQETERARIAFLQFQSSLADMKKHLSQDDIFMAGLLYKKMMEQYGYIMQSRHVADTAKRQIDKQFSSLYQTLKLWGQQEDGHEAG